MRSVTVALALLLARMAAAQAGAHSVDDFRQDFDYAWREIGENYAYFDARQTRWQDIPRLYASDLQRVTDRDGLVALLEQVVDELYDPHAQLTVNLPDSARLVPSGTDLWAEWQGGRAVVTQVRNGSDAEHAGIRADDVILSLDGVAIGQSVEARLGRSYPHQAAAARDWALRAVLAGRHSMARHIELLRAGARFSVELAAADQFRRPTEPLSQAILAGAVGYIRLNDSLGSTDTVAAFDRALDALGGSRGLIIDLRDTASGGDSAVARGILGRFVAREIPYQKHVLPSEQRDTGVRRSWLELVSPRGRRYAHPVVVVVNRWTGSMGEGLAIGFDATRAATVVGTAMAGLVGATEHFTLPHSGVGINVPTERLYHVGGLPREQFKPRIVVDVVAAAPGADPFLAAALRQLGVH